MKYKSYKETLLAPNPLLALKEYLKDKNMTMTEFLISDEYMNAPKGPTSFQRPFKYHVVGQVKPKQKETK